MTPLVEAYRGDLFPWTSEECKWLTVGQLAGLVAKTGYRRYEALPLPLLTAKGTPYVQLRTGPSRIRPFSSLSLGHYASALPPKPRPMSDESRNERQKHQSEEESAGLLPSNAKMTFFCCVVYY